MTRPGLLSVVLLLAGCPVDPPLPQDPRIPVDAGDVGDVGHVESEAADAGTPLPHGLCPTLFRYVPPPGRVVHRVALAGEWSHFQGAGIPMHGPEGDGAFTATVQLDPGTFAWQPIVDGQVDAVSDAALQRYVNGVAYAAMRVPDCLAPRVEVLSQDVSRTAQNEGVIDVRLGTPTGLDSSRLTATLVHDFKSETPLSAYSSASGEWHIKAAELADGKYTLIAEVSNSQGHGTTLRLVFWIEPEKFEWKDALLYLVMTDRFRDGDRSNDVAPTAGVDPRAVLKGGDFEGVRQAIADGTFDKLGVRALWLTPFHKNPSGAFPADDGVHLVTAYHGYWPLKAREVEPRLGGEAALKAMVREAHAHGIRVLQDFVVNHVHKEHEYFARFPSWFRTGCVCGTPGCSWDDKRLECLFADYLPDVNWTSSVVSDQYADDAVWWLDTFDLDGLRIDAVKHVEDAAIVNLTERLRREFEASGNKLFLTGETAMGWSGDRLEDNAGQYGTIARYIGPHGLDGQFDFVLYHAAAYRVFATSEKGLAHADYWAQASGWSYPAGALMTPFIGSHDAPRFVTLATYRGQRGFDASVPNNKWTDPAGPPVGSEPYERLRLALAWVLTLPGAPMLFQGDEYGEWGGQDPNNRTMWRGDGALSNEEQATLDFARKVGSARRELVALRRGSYRSLYASDNLLVFARQTEGGDAAVVVLSTSTAPLALEVPLPQTLPLAAGATLKDRLSSRALTVTPERTLRLELPAGRVAQIWAP